MDVKLIEDWQKILAGAWSVRLMALCAILSALNEAAAYMPQLGIDIPSWVLTLLAASSIGARLLYQVGISK